jgi:hypothetical protein
MLSGLNFEIFNELSSYSNIAVILQSLFLEQGRFSQKESKKTYPAMCADDLIFRWPKIL